LFLPSAAAPLPGFRRGVTVAAAHMLRYNSSAQCRY
jgi:hypothetical protein